MSDSTDLARLRHLARCVESAASDDAEFQAADLLCWLEEAGLYESSDGQLVPTATMERASAAACAACNGMRGSGIGPDLGWEACEECGGDGWTMPDDEHD